MTATSETVADIPTDRLGPHVVAKDNRIEWEACLQPMPTRSSTPPNPTPTGEQTADPNHRQGGCGVAKPPARGAKRRTNDQATQVHTFREHGSPSRLVEVLGRYSNQTHLVDRLRKATEAAESDPPRTTYTAPPRKTTTPVRERLDEQAIAKLVERYEAGESSERLGERFGLSKRSVLEVLHRAGATVRLPRMSEAETEEAARLYGTGLSLAAVGKRLGRDHSTIYKVLKRAGVRMRDTHGRP